jgi:MYXO-CTERM domain-containing protein
VAAVGLGLALGGLAASEARGASIVFNVANGDWNTASNWSPTTSVPGTTAVDIAFIRGNRVANIDAPTAPNNSPTSGIDIVRIGEAATGLGPGTLNIGAGGTLTTIRDIEVMRRGTLADAHGTLNLTGGSIDVGGTFYIGAGTTNNSGNGTGTLNASGTSSIVGSMTIGTTSQDDGSGTFNVIGNGVSFGDGGAAKALIVNDFGAINFNLGSTVGPTWNFAASPVTFNAGAGLVVDGTNYTGPDGTFTLINGLSLVGTAATVDESTVNFAPGRAATINFDTASGDVTLTVTPEPASAGVLAVAGLLAIGSRRRRR